VQEATGTAGGLRKFRKQLITKDAADIRSVSIRGLAVAIKRPPRPARGRAIALCKLCSLSGVSHEVVSML